MPSERSDGITQTKRSYGKRRSATAGCFRIRIADDELRTLQTFRIVDFRADQILIAHRIDQKDQTVFLNFEIVAVFDFIKSKSVLETRTSAAIDKNSQFQIGIVFFGNQIGNTGTAAVAKNNRASIRHSVKP